MKNTSTLDEILERLHLIQQELEQEFDHLLDEKRKQFQYSIRRGRVVFARNARNWQRQYRISLWPFLSKAPFSVILSSPIIYGMLIPLSLLDLSISLYQHICFRIYDIPLVRRADYLIIDRQHLDYLNIIQKFNCIYCGYGNGVIEYAREVLARTEQYWCPIKHAQHTLSQHKRTQKFFDYGDANSWNQKLVELRKDLTTERSQND